MCATPPAFSWPPRWVPPALLAITVLAFAPTLSGGFLGDDFVYIARFWNFSWSDWPRLFVREWSEGIWGFGLKELRPFAALSFMADAKLWGDWATGHRLTNLLLHLTVVWLVAQLCWHYTTNKTATLVAGLVFALHPTHAEPVAWITGRVDLLATAGALGFWLAAEDYSAGKCRRALPVGLSLLFVGVFSKELALTAPLLLGIRWSAFEFFTSRPIWQRRVHVLAGVGIIVVIYAICRHAAFGTGIASAGSSWTDGGSWQRQASYAGWLAPILPFKDLHEWLTPPAARTMQLIGLALASAIAVASVFAVRRRAITHVNALFFGGVWYLVTVGGLLVVPYFSPRHLYFPSVGLALGCGLLVALLGRWPLLRAMIAAGLVCWCGFAHVAAIKPWIENGRISREAIAALNRDPAATNESGTLLLVAIPEIRLATWLWSWSSPYAFGEPFLDRPFAPAQIVERVGNYYRPDSWSKDRQPVAAVRAAQAAVALVLDEAGQPKLRRLEREELQARVNTLASAASDGITPEEWTSWVTSLTQP